MEKETTARLMEILKSSEPESFGKFEKEHLETGVDFVHYMDEIIEKKEFKRQDIFQKADLPQKYGYKLLSGESHTTDRDKLLRLFIAMNLSLKEVQRALAYYGFPTLYPKKKRDALLIIAFNRSMNSVEEVNEWLISNQESELSISR